jgi:hypothetical protein
MPRGDILSIGDIAGPPRNDVVLATGSRFRYVRESRCNHDLPPRGTRLVVDDELPSGAVGVRLPCGHRMVLLPFPRFVEATWHEGAASNP